MLYIPRNQKGQIMGYSKIFDRTDYWPDSTEDKLYIADGTVYDLSDLHDIARDWFKTNAPDVELIIELENIHTSAIYHDQHDAADYTMFYVLQRK
jgi:hypothetical protein